MVILVEVDSQGREPRRSAADDLEIIVAKFRAFFVEIREFHQAFRLGRTPAFSNVILLLAR